MLKALLVSVSDDVSGRLWGYPLPVYYTECSDTCPTLTLHKISTH